MLAAVAVVVLTASPSYAQDVMPDLERGSKALLFQANVFNTTVATVNDGGVAGFGAKYYLSPTTAVRGVLEIAKSSTTIPANPTPPQVGADGSTDTSAVGVSIAVERHFGMGRMSPYYGGGVLFRTSSREEVTAATATPPATPVQTVTKGGFSTANRFGVMGIFGAEFFLRDNVSLAAEYMLAFISNSLKDTEVTVGTNPTTTTKNGSVKTLSSAVSSAAMRLGFYF
jgi:outer membrane protein W